MVNADDSTPPIFDVVNDVLRSKISARLSKPRINRIGEVTIHEHGIVECVYDLTVKGRPIDPEPQVRYRLRTPQEPSIPDAPRFVLAFVGEALLDAMDDKATTRIPINDHDSLDSEGTAIRTLVEAFVKALDAWPKQ
jgi:hypothetical protein